LYEDVCQADKEYEQLKKQLEISNDLGTDKENLIVHLQQQNAKLVEALEFYAYPESYCIDLGRIMEACIAVAVDNGKIAAAALKEAKGE